MYPYQPVCSPIPEHYSNALFYLGLCQWIFYVRLSHASCLSARSIHEKGCDGAVDTLRMLPFHDNFTKPCSEEYNLRLLTGSFSCGTSMWYILVVFCECPPF